MDNKLGVVEKLLGIVKSGKQSMKIVLVQHAVGVGGWEEGEVPGKA